MNEVVLGYMITWTVYGTFLQGDDRWWHKRNKGSISPQPRLYQWQADQLKYPIMLPTDLDRRAIEEAIAEHAAHRGWHLWAANARSNHVHTVITAKDVKGKKVRDQLKANCTRALRERCPDWRNRPVWSEGGHCECLNTEDELEAAIEYVLFAQDLKHLDERYSQGG